MRRQGLSATAVVLAAGCLALAGARSAAAQADPPARPPAERGGQGAPEGAPRTGPRDAAPAQGAAAAAAAARRKSERIYGAYDGNGDRKVTFAEWLRMKEGVPDAARAQREQALFASVDLNRDGTISVEEFVTWQTARGQRRDAGPAKAGPREGEGVRKPGPRDGEAPRKPGPRDGDAPRPGPRDPGQ